MKSSRCQYLILITHPLIQRARKQRLWKEKKARKASEKAQRVADAKALKLSQAKVVADPQAAQVVDQGTTEHTEQEHKDTEVTQQEAAQPELQAVGRIAADQAQTQADQKSAVCFSMLIAPRVLLADFL